jgi:hypothetical protein
MSQRWINAWDDSQTITGSVYVTPQYSSGPENGQNVYTAPATKHFTAGQGAPARHVNYMGQQLGLRAVEAALHDGMTFHGSGTWANLLCGGVARSNRGFLIGNTTSAVFTRDAVASHAQTIIQAAIGVITVVHDDGFHVAEFERNAGGQARFASSSTVSSTAFTGATFPMAAATIGANSFFLATTGTGMLAWTYSGTSLVPTATTAGVPGGISIPSSSATIWGTAQAYVGATTATGPVIFYPKGASTNHYLFTADCVAVADNPWTGPPANTLADVAYDDVQGKFVAAFYSSTGSRVSFMTSPDGLAWTTSSTAQGPANLQVPSGAATGSVAFKICAGVWFLAMTSNQPPNYVYGSSAGAGLEVFGFYSIDYGQTWYPADLTMANASSGATLRIKHSHNQFMVMHDSDISLSGRLGYPEPIA